MIGADQYRLGVLPLAHPDARALSTATTDITYAELDRRVALVAAGLRAAGMKAGDRILALLPSGTEIYELVMACARTSTVLVPMNWRLSPDELVRIAEHAEARAVVVHRDSAAVAPRLVGAHPTALQLTVHADDGSALDYETWREHQAPGTTAEHCANDDVVLQIYTSGTTGRPKGVLLTHGNLVAKIPRAVQGWDVTAESISLLATPLFHIGGLGWGLIGLASGARTVVLGPSRVETLFAALRDERVTHAFLVPTMLHDLCALATADGLPDLRLIVYGAAPIPTKTRDAVLDAFGCSLAHVYGLTETTGSITQDLTPPTAERGQAVEASFVGYPFPGIEISVRDPDSHGVLPPGRPGEVWTRSAQNSPGYAKDPTATAELLTTDGWLRTGDAGRLQADGGLVLTHRIKDLIVTGGENVVPAEVEAVLRQHPDVLDAAVVGLPHPRWGEMVAAAVVTRDQRPADGLDEFTLERLAAYKRPRVVHVVDELPRNALGKVDQQQLAQRLVAMTEQVPA
ncbi:MAG: AMP-binding protein [Candidatus Nanopelagicales bacterium]